MEGPDYLVREEVIPDPPAPPLLPPPAQPSPHLRVTELGMVGLLVTPWTVALQAPLSTEFSR